MNEGAGNRPLFRGADSPRTIFRLRWLQGRRLREGMLLPDRYTRTTARALARAVLLKGGPTLVPVPEPSTWFVALKVSDWYRRGYSRDAIAKKCDFSRRYVDNLIRAYDLADDWIMAKWKVGELGLSVVLSTVGRTKHD